MQYCYLEYQILRFSPNTHSWASFPLWPTCSILSEAISSCPLLFPSSILDTSDLGGSCFSVLYFCLFIQFMRFSWQVYWGGLPFVPPVLSEISSMSYLSWIYVAWLVASSSYTSPFATTRQWSMKVEHWRTDVFELWCWRRLLKVLWIARISNIKGNKPWIIFGRTDAEAEAPVFCSSDINSWLVGKVPDAGKDWGQKEKRASEDEMTGWHLWWNGHEHGHWANFKRWWGTERPGMLQPVESQRVRHDWVTEQQ